MLYFRQLKKNLTSCVTVRDINFSYYTEIILKFQPMVFHETQKQNSKFKGKIKKNVLLTLY